MPIDWIELYSGPTRHAFWSPPPARRTRTCMAALELLGIDETGARRIGLGVYKIALIFPLEPVGLEPRRAAAEEIFFVEEKRAHAEIQAKTLLYNHERRPRVTGKLTPDGGAAFAGRWAARRAACRRGAGGAPARRLCHPIDAGRAGLRGGRRRESTHRLHGSPRCRASSRVARRPAFCPGCPHNSSTKVPPGSFGVTGIGCHSMVLFQRERNPLPMGQMGAEGAHWIGLSAFTSTPHVFQNLGDGTYNHSGSLAIRAAVQARVNITYKILLNDAVAMTGGQPVEGSLTVSRVVQQVRAEGVAHVVVVRRIRTVSRRATRCPRGPSCGIAMTLPPSRKTLRLQSGCQCAGLRSGLRGGEAPPAQDQSLSGSRSPPVHQCRGLRRMRRLLGGIQLPGRAAARNGLGTQARYRPVRLQ